MNFIIGYHGRALACLFLFVLIIGLIVNKRKIAQNFASSVLAFDFCFLLGVGFLLLWVSPYSPN